MNNSCGCNENVKNVCSNTCRGNNSSYLIVLVLYILLAILFTSWVF